MIEIEPHLEYAALFDRTESQRKRHSELSLELRASHPNIGATVISHLADRRMEKEFYEDINRLAEERVPLLWASDSQPTEDEHEALRQAALGVVAEQIGELNEAYGFPMLELRGPKADV